MNIAQSPKNIIRKERPYLLVERFRKARFMALATGLSLLYQLVFPSISWALTSGPSSPEFSSFEPVATTNMVNEFTGQFTYNLPVLEIPGANGAGYALSLAYHSGESPEAESSWVGYGWSLNPGCINRSKRGLPDDFKGDSTNPNITFHNSVPPNWTVAGTASASAQIFSAVGGGVSGYATVRYNNYKGFGFTEGLGLSAMDGTLSLGFSITDGDGTFSAAVNPAAILTFISDQTKSNHEDGSPQSARQAPKMGWAGIGMAMKQSVQRAASAGLAGACTHYINYLLTDMTSPYNTTPYTGQSLAGSVSVTGDPGPVPVGWDVGLNISYSVQKNVGTRSVAGYGYMYSGNAYNNDSSQHEAVMDYTVEHPSTFNQRDKYLPVPFSTPDAFLVSGEGISGGFRMYNDGVGMFSPNYVQSKTKKDFFGLDVHLGDDLGLGAEVIIGGSTTLTVQSSWTDFSNKPIVDEDGNSKTYWFRPYDFRDTLHTVSEATFFRFNNDLGGKLNYDRSDLPEPPIINGTTPNLPAFNQVTTGANLNKMPTGGRRNARASFIGYHTNKEIGYTSSTGISALAYEKDAKVMTQAGRIGSGSNAPADGIGEIATTNESGNHYVYGLPVYTNHEKNLQYSLNLQSGSDNFLVNTSIAGMSEVGEEYLKPYASSYLLTQITTPDYVDINQNGPDDGDFGGYTKFIYRQAKGSSDKTSITNCYQWRVPYKGCYYKPNQLSDRNDDMGSYQYGYKEVYYLDTIMTKTHFAVFVTDHNRSDGIQAASEYSAGLGNAGSGNAPEILKTILLYAKSTNGQPAQLIKTVHFDYNYQCWPGIPNSSVTGSGKLTLKKVWFEYNGVANAYISPYQFDYTYPVNANYPSQYSPILSEMSAYGAGEQPSYNPYVDCWGNYMYNGSTRRNNLQSWDSQVPATNFDPAAWQLKRITLPSGGEIHVQYEQNTYSYVQDQSACAMVKLATNDNAPHNQFDIDLTDVGITAPGDPRINQMVALINSTYATQKIYFKFFYTLMGRDATSIGNCNGDYIDGYTNFVNASVSTRDPSKITIQVSTAGGGSTVVLPRDLCLDYIHHEVGGKLKTGSCTAQSEDLTDPGADKDNLESIAKQFVSAVKAALAANSTTCLTLNPSLSYFRIPLPKKIGGGIRVKRLLMYNKGVDNNAQTLYGTQYIYDNTSDGTSYGVATNEPSENKEENPLITYLEKRTSQSWSDKLIAGKDRQQFEGPLGMNALPAASIGYSRVIKVNIAQAKDIGTGFTVADYYTVKDYPYNRSYVTGGNGVSFSDIQTVTDNWDLDIGLFSYQINTGMRSAQGYCFIQNQMHGQIKSIATYPGAYFPSHFYSITSPPVPVSQQTYTYFEPGESVPMYDFLNYAISYDQPGREMDVSVDRRCVKEDSKETRLTGDVTFGEVFIVIPWIIAFPVTSKSQSRLRTIVSNKVIHYPAIVKSITVVKDGIKQTTDNIAFDPLTTQPVITATYDGFNGLYLQNKPNKPHKGDYWQYNFPASSQYNQMGQQAWNELYCYYTNTGSYIPVSYTGTTGQYNVNGVNPNNMFVPGDLIALFRGGTGAGIVDMAHVTAVSGANLTVSVAVSTGTTSLATNGTTYVKTEIIHSGYTNQLASSAGSLLTYDSMWLYTYAPRIGDTGRLIVEDSSKHMNLVKANMTTYMDSPGNWAANRLSLIPYSLPANYSSYNIYEAGRKGIWRPSMNYVYKDTIVDRNNPSEYVRIYDRAGTHMFDLSPGNLWTSPYMLANYPFIKTSQSLLYTPDGNPVLDQDIDGVYSTAKYGYRGVLPYLVAQNSNYGSVFFESFENIYNSAYAEDSMAVNNTKITTAQSHTGKSSYYLAYGDMITLPQINDNLGGGLVVRFWAYATGDIHAQLNVRATVGTSSTNYPTTFVARSGPWALYEFKWVNTVPNTSVIFNILPPTILNSIYVDDIRVQQTSSKTTAYVYDKGTFKLSATLDDQNFATYYQYNGEGKLVRKLVETQRGVLTAEETQYHTPLINR